MLIDNIIDFCDKSYVTQCKEKCIDCNHPSQCPQNCEICLEQVHYPYRYINGRTDYNCKKIVDFYSCKYLYKYASEIEYVLRHSQSIDNFSDVRMVSIGCGPSPDLMAVQHYLAEKNIDIPIKYLGFDYNELWKPVQNEIYKNASDYGITKLIYRFEDAVDYFSKNHLYKANMLVLQYVLSHMNIEGRSAEITPFFRDLTKHLITEMQENSIIILNDINHNSVRDRFIELYEVIKDSKRELRCSGYYFDYNIKNSNQRYGTNHPENRVIYDIPANIYESYNPWDKCTSAQLLIEIR